MEDIREKANKIGKLWEKKVKHRTLRRVYFKNNNQVKEFFGFESNLKSKDIVFIDLFNCHIHTTSQDICIKARENGFKVKKLKGI